MRSSRLAAQSAISRARRAFGRFTRNPSGATAIEFGIVVVPFFGFVLLILQVGLYHFSLQSLDFAVRQAGRTVMTGRVSSSVASASDFKTSYVCPNVFFTIDCGKLILNSFRVGKSSDSSASTGVYAYLNATTKQLNAPVTNPATQSFCLGGPGDYIYIDAAYPYPNFMKRLLSPTASDTWLLRSSTMIYNEPNAKGGSAC